MDSENRNQISIVMDIPADMIEHISGRAENETVAEIKRLAKNKLLEARCSYSYINGGIRDTRNDAVSADPLQDWVKDMVKELLNENKDLIIEKAAHELAMSMSRSKTVRDKFADRLEEIVDG